MNTLRITTTAPESQVCADARTAFALRVGSWLGRAWQLCPVNSDVDLLCDLNGVVYLNASCCSDRCDVLDLWARLTVERKAGL